MISRDFYFATPLAPVPFAAAGESTLKTSKKKTTTV
jgi:hypothetical protein